MTEQAVVQTRQKAPTAPVASGILQRACACGQHTGSGGECAECKKKRMHLEHCALAPSPYRGEGWAEGRSASPSEDQKINPAPKVIMNPWLRHDFSQVRVRRAAPETIQTKLLVNRSGDKYEQEADRTADMVLRMPTPVFSTDRGSFADLVIPSRPWSCQKNSESPDIQAATALDATYAVPPQIERDLSVLKDNHGQPLPAATLAFMEPRFGRDFSDVRVHTDARAGALAQSVNARAFTVGGNLVFGPGQYSPDTRTGRHLLAHELTHAVQQGAVNDSTGKISTSEPAIQRAEPVTTLTIGAAVAKCIIGALTGTLFDAAIQAILYSIKEWTWRFWRASWDYCSLILSAIIGCIAAPVSAALLEPWITAQLGAKLGGLAGTLTGKILLFIAKKVAIGIPKFIVKSLAKLGCISPEQAAELGVTPQTPDEPVPTPIPVPAPLPPVAATCTAMSGDIVGDERVLMKVNTVEFLTREEEVKFDMFTDSLRASNDNVKVHGLASSDGPAAFNDRLSCTRATRAAELLHDRGIPASRITGIFKHGEVPGPAEWERSVVFEREAVGPGPEPRPPTPTPTPGTPRPTITLKSIRFTSDHGVMKNNRNNWENSGDAFPEPEWQASDPTGISAPISHTKGQAIQIEVVLDVSPTSLTSVPFVLKGQGGSDALTFERAGSVSGGANQVIVMIAKSPLEDEIHALSGRSIVWSIVISDSIQPLGTSLGHDIFVTYSFPRDGVTYLRMAKAVELTQGWGNMPHDIVSRQMARFPEYNLKLAFPNAWQVADDMKTAADCQTIVRFIQGVNDMIGLPGESRGISVYASPTAPTTPLHGTLTEKGGPGMFLFPPQPGTGFEAGLYDGGDNYNNYEAALEFEHGGKQLFYPGGVNPPGVGLKAMKDVLYVFKQMAWGDFDPVLRKSVPRVTIYCYKRDTDGPPCP